MKQTAVEWLVDKILVQQELHTDKEGDYIDIPRITYTNAYKDHVDLIEFVEKAKEMEKTNIDNKVIHFAEWLTKRHTLELMTLYDYFEEQYYNETYKGK